MLAEGALLSISRSTFSSAGLVPRAQPECHLGESHRPTLDIDTAANEAHETLVALGAPGDSDHRRIVEGVKVEIIEVRCEDLAVTVPVARRLPLIACKLHAWLDRRDQRAEKRGSDGLDIVRLLQTADWDAMTTDASDVDGLGEVVEWAADAVSCSSAG